MSSPLAEIIWPGFVSQEKHPQRCRCQTTLILSLWFFSQVTSHLSQNPSTFWHFQENTGSGFKTSPALTSESTYVKNTYSNINRGGDGSRWMQRVSVLQVLSTEPVFSIVSHQRLPWIRVSCYKRAKNAVI